jgi:hypothetical protein
VQRLLVLEPQDVAAVLVLVVPDVGDGLELDAAGSHRLHLTGQAEQVQRAVHRQGVRHRLDQLALLAEVEQHLVVEQLAHHASDEDLLADDPVEVAAGEPVPLPDERQRLLALDDLRSGRQIDAGVLVLHRSAEIDLDAAEDGAQVEEAEQVDLGVVVDLQAGEAADRADEKLRSRPTGARRRWRVPGSY